MVKNGDENILKGQPVGYKEKYMYALSHLATFNVKTETLTKNPREKINLLIELDKNGGIWPLRMFMCICGQWLVMLDNDKNEIENLPGSLIKEPTAFVSEDPLEVFNNILIYAVPGISLGISELHMFQVCDVSAAYLVEKLNLLSFGIPIYTEQNTMPIHVAKAEHLEKAQYGINSNVIEENVYENQQYDRNILVANHCFEDIERFVTRLQFAAEAIQELERNQHAHNPHGEGLLVLRSRPPLKNEFHDVIGKHKLALNCIVNLHKNMNDAAKPIRNVLTSLKTVVNVCKTIYIGEMIPENVVNPLLKRETLNFLIGCLNEEEIAFWNSLGHNWVSPRDQFKDHKGSYHPIFYDDWSPDWNVDDPVGPILIVGRKEITILQKHLQETWLVRLKTRNVKIAQVIYNRMCRNVMELEVFTGEYLEIIDDSRKWWKSRNCMGKIGYVPQTILMPQNFEPRSISDQQDTNSLSSFELEKDETYLVKTNTQSEATQNMPRSLSMPNVPAPPPMPEFQTIATRAKLDRNGDSGSSFVVMRARNNCDATTEALKEELKHNLRQREQRRDLEILKTPQIYINQHSSPIEVMEWLRGKGFPDVIVRKLQTFSGAELFALSPHVIEGYFGQNESRRLISQILLQKNISEYKSVRSSELSTKLAQVRQKMEIEDNIN